MFKIELYEKDKVLSIEDLDRFMTFISNDSGAVRQIPIVLSDTRGLMNNPNVKTIVERMMTYPFVISLRHDGFTSILNSWKEFIDDLIYNFRPRIFVNIDIKNKDLAELHRVFNLFTIKEPSFIELEYTIKDSDFDIESLINLIAANGLGRCLKLKLDHSNVLNYKEIGTKISSYSELRRERIVGIGFDCGFPVCMFTKEQIGDLYLTPLKDFHFICKPLPIIYPDLTIQHCDLIKERIKLSECQSVSDMLTKLSQFANGDNSDEFNCSSCWSYDKLCFGGCKMI